MIFKLRYNQIYQLKTTPEQKQCKREAKILRLLEVLRMYSDFLKDMQISGEVTKGCGQVRLGVAMAPNQQEILTCSKYF